MMIEYRYIPREGIPMNIHDERKRLAEQAVKTFSHFVEENIEKFGRVLEREEPNRPRIDDVEEMWGERKTRANQIITATGRGELYDGLVKTAPEKEMIAKKKRIRRTGGGSEERERSILKVKHGGEEERKRMKEAVPLDEYLGITGLPFKMTKQMMDEAAFWGQN
jgi:hypothetical protein